MLITISAAIIPVLFILFVIYKIDTEKEPISLLIKCFVWGMLIVLPVVLVEHNISEFGKRFFPEGFYTNFYTAFFVAGLTEEVFKFIVLWYVLKKSKYFDQYYDGIVYAVFVSMGFALVENILYVIQHGMTTAIIRGFISVPAHAFFGIFMGYHLSLWRIGKPEHKQANLALALIIPIILHGLFDFFLMDMSHRGESQPIIVLFYMVCFFALNLWFWRTAYKRIKGTVAKDTDTLND